jgi:excisionase family DNA binding protein
MENTMHMTVAEASEALGVSERTVWRYLSSGRLVGETVGPVGSQRTLIEAVAVQAIVSGRGGGEEITALKAEVARLGDENARLRADGDQMRRSIAGLRAQVVQFHKPVSKRAGDLVLAGLSSLASRRTAR